MKRKIQKEWHEEICQKRRSGQTVKSLAKEYNVSETAIGRTLRANGVKIAPRYFRKHWFDFRFFDEIDSEEKSYILGFLYADGSNCPKNGKVTLELQDADKEILEKIATAIGFSGKLFPLTPRCKGKVYPSCRLSLNSRIFSDRCSELGVVYDKSFKIQMPSETIVPPSLLPHFIRGYFDGDGSFSFRPEKSRFATINFIGNPLFIDQLQQYFVSALSIKGSTHPHKNQKSKYLGISGNLQIERVLEHLYQNATIYLKRKHDKYIIFKGLRRTFSRKAGCSSRFFGVSKTEDKTWKAGVNFGGKQHYLGAFKTEEEAARVYDKWCRERGHNLQLLNFPKSEAVDILLAGVG